MSDRRVRKLGLAALLVVLASLALVLTPLPDDTDQGRQPTAPAAAPSTGAAPVGPPQPQGRDGPAPVRVTEPAAVLTDRVAVASFAVDRPARIVVRFLGPARALLGERRLTVRGAGEATARIALERPVTALSAAVRAIPFAGGPPTVLRIAARRLALRIASPVDGAVIEGPRVLVRVAVRGLEIGPRGAAPGPWRGHLHVVLDRRPPIRLDATRVVLGAVTPGRHRLSVRADRSDDRPFAGLERPVTVAFSTRAIRRATPGRPGLLPGPDAPPPRVP